MKDVLKMVNLRTRKKNVVSLIGIRAGRNDVDRADAHLQLKFNE